MSNIRDPRQIKYYDLKKYWQRRIKPHLANEEFNRVLIEDFNKFTMGRWGRPFCSGQCPFDFESCDWYLRNRGRPPHYRRYVKHAASHWLVNANLILASLAEPARSWRIITGDHSSVWDGETTLFDINFYALEVDPSEAFALAFDKVLEPGKLMQVGYPLHYTER